MVHGVIGMRVVIQVLIKIPPFDPEVFIEAPAEASKHAVLIEAGLTARRCRIGTYEELIPRYQT